MKAMFMLKLKLAAAVVAVGVVVPATGLVTYQAPAAPPESQPATAPQEKELTLAQVCQFGVEKGRLMMRTEVPNEPPIRNVKVTVKGLSGDTRMMLGFPQAFKLTNSGVVERDGQTAMNEIRVFGTSLRLQRMVQPKGDEAYSVLLMQAYEDGGIQMNLQKFDLKAGEVLLTIQRKNKIAKEDEHTAKDFDALAAENPVEYWRYVGPLFRQFGAKDLYPLPTALTRKVLEEPEAVQADAALRRRLRSYWWS